jgi:hypothetical protein
MLLTGSVTSLLLLLEVLDALELTSCIGLLDHQLFKQFLGSSKIFLGSFYDV